MRIAFQIHAEEAPSHSLALNLTVHELHEIKKRQAHSFISDQSLAALSRRKGFPVGSLRHQRSMSVGHGAALSQKRIDQNSEPGKALQKVVQVKLKDFLGQDYADDVLPLYIVVMLAHGNQADLVADNLEAFLGQAPAQLFVQWYASKLIPPLHITSAGCVSHS